MQPFWTIDYNYYPIDGFACDAFWQCEPRPWHAHCCLLLSAASGGVRASVKVGGIGPIRRLAGLVLVLLLLQGEGPAQIRNHACMRPSRLSSSSMHHPRTFKPGAMNRGYQNRACIQAQKHSKMCPHSA